MTVKTIKHAMFNYTVGGIDWVAFRGASVDLSDDDVTRGAAVDAFFANGDVLPPVPAVQTLQVGTPPTLPPIGSGGSHVWTPNTTVAAGELLVANDVIYIVDSNFTTPAVFDEDNLTPLAGVVAITGAGGVSKVGVVSIDAADISTADTTGIVSKQYVDNSASGTIVYEDVATASYDFVSADAGKCKRFLRDCAARILPGVFEKGDWVDGIQKGTGAVTITGQATPAQITFPYTLAVPHTTATNSHTIAVPSGADIQDHDLVLFFVQYGLSKAWTPHSSTGAVFTQEGSQAGVTSGGFSSLFKAVDVTASAIKGQTLTFSFTGTAIISDGLLIVVRGAHRTTPIDGHVDTGVGASGTAGSTTSPALTTVAAGCVGLSLAGKSSGATAGSAFSVPSPVTLLLTDFTTAGGAGGNASTGAGQYGSPGGLAAGSAIGGRVWSPAGTVGAPGNARTVAIRPHIPAGVLFDASDGTVTVDQGSVFTIASEGPNASAQEEFVITGKLTT